MMSRATTLTVASILLVGLVSVALLMPVPYVTMKPGRTVDTLGESQRGPVVEFGPKAKTYGADGELRMTTVSVTSPDSEVGLAQALEGWFDSDVAVLPRDMVYPPDQTVEEAEHQTQLEMSGSQTSAQVAGLTEAGFDVKTFVEVVTVVSDSPASGELAAGDRLLKVDGTMVATPQEAVDAIQKREPGDSVVLTIRRDGTVRQVEITTEPSPDEPSVPVVGVEISVGHDTPFSITYHVSPRIGGPSAGAMFALAIYDRLTPGSLTGGEIVAGTGEIDVDGRIGPIGGIQQKLLAAKDAGAAVFIVPRDNCDEAVDVDVDGVQLVAAGNLHQAVTSLDALADDPNADVPDCE